MIFGLTLPLFLNLLLAADHTGQQKVHTMCSEHAKPRPVIRQPCQFLIFRCKIQRGTVFELGTPVANTTSLCTTQPIIETGTLGIPAA